MIVMRFTHTAKPGKRNELIKLLKDYVEGTGSPGRVLTPGYTNWDTVQLEVEWETEEDRQKWRADDHRERMSQSEHTDFLEKLSALRESGSTRVEWQTH